MLRYLALFLAIATPAYGLPLTYAFVAGGSPGTFTWDSDIGVFSLEMSTGHTPYTNNHEYDLGFSGGASVEHWDDGFGRLTSGYSHPRGGDLWPSNLDAWPVYGYDVSFYLSADGLFGENNELRPDLMLSDFSRAYVEVLWSGITAYFEQPAYGDLPGQCPVGTPEPECPISSFHVFDYIDSYYLFTEFHAVPEPGPAPLVCVAGILVSLGLRRRLRSACGSQ